MPLVSAVIPTFNCAHYLKEAVESALAQTHRRIEVVVVDDGSTDRTREVCESFGDKIRYIYRLNDGTRGNGARALAIRESRGEWVALLDHDDRWLPTKIEEQLAAAAADPEVGLVFTGAAVIDPAGRRTGATFDPGPSGDVFHQLLRGTRYCAASALVRRDAVDLVRRTAPEGDFLADPRPWNNDTDLWMRVARHHPVKYLGGLLTEYRYHASNDSYDRVRLWATDLTVLDAKPPYFHPGCRECAAGYRAGRAAIRRRLAAAQFDRFVEAAARREPALGSLAAAWRSDARVVLHPRRLGAALKYAVPAAFTATRRGWRS
jgi:glycosyltransferase involved in cell wall biosynthesis